MNFLGIDLGTSAVKALVVDGDQTVLASASEPLTIQRPEPLWSEQNPEDWWAAATKAVRKLAAGNPEAWRAVGAIGLSGQMHGAVVLDNRDAPLRPAILWNDGRARREAEELNRRVPDIGRIAGVPAMAGFAAPKLLWLMRHEPEVFICLRRLVLPKDYLRLRMTGELATDMVDGSGALLLDAERRAWSEEIAGACGLKLKNLPRSLEGNALSGHLNAAAATAWNLPAGLPVAAGAGDAAAGAIGIGAVEDGDAFISLGTSAQIFVTRGRHIPAPARLIHAFCHGLPHRWFQMAALLNGASCLAWAAELLGAESVAALMAETEAARPGPSGLTFLPYLAGERTPLNDPLAKGVFAGLTPAASRAHLFQAVLEGVALSLADCQDHLDCHGPLGVIGGGSRSPYFLRLIAAILNRPLHVFEGGETGPAFGAARLARLCVTGEAPQSVCVKPPAAAHYAPDPALAAAYAPKLAAFRDLYRALKPVHHG